MKITDLLVEMQMGRYASGGTTPTGGPIAKKNAAIAYNVVKSIGNAPTAREKIDIITSLKAGTTTNKIVINDQHGKHYSFKGYDKSTGDISLANMQGIPCKTNVEDLEFVGKERSISSTIKKWIFTSNKIVSLDSDTPDPKRGGGRPSKPVYTLPSRLW
jgi:hypothetical protein